MLNNHQALHGKRVEYQLKVVIHNLYSDFVFMTEGTLCCQCQRDILCSSIVMAIQVVQPMKKKSFGVEMNAVFVGGVLGW